MEEEPTSAVESIRAVLREPPASGFAPENAPPATIVAVGRIALLDAVVIHQDDVTP